MSLFQDKAKKKVLRINEDQIAVYIGFKCIRYLYLFQDAWFTYVLFVLCVRMDSCVLIPYYSIIAIRNKYTCNLLKETLYSMMFIVTDELK